MQRVQRATFSSIMRAASLICLIVAGGATIGYLMASSGPVASSSLDLLLGSLALLAAFLVYFVGWQQRWQRKRVIWIRLRVLAAIATILMSFSVIVPSASASRHSAPAPSAINAPQVAFADVALPDGLHARVYRDGIADLTDQSGRHIGFRRLPVANPDAPIGSPGGLPDENHTAALLMQTPDAPSVPNEVVLVLAAGTHGPAGSQVFDPHLTQGKTTPAQYTSDPTLNATMAAVHADRMTHLFASEKGNKADKLYAAQVASGHATLDFANAYLVHLSGSSTATAMAALRKVQGVQLAEPAFEITSMMAPSVPITSDQQSAALSGAKHLTAITHADQTQSSLPTNYDLVSGAQSLFAPHGINAASAYDAVVHQFNQLPGQDEIITNVSVGDLIDASENKVGDPCQNAVISNGPTTIVSNGQRYLDWPSMPLIPTYTANADGTTNPTGEVCGQDATLGEVGLDFSMMAPLPHDQQRTGRTGSGYSDLLGIAPGAQYRLVVPASASPTNADLASAFIAAALQTPRPNVITASLGFGLDAVGFPGRYLEDDPLLHLVVTAIVQYMGIVVCISANDGTRLYTNAAIGPSGGSAPTQRIDMQGITNQLNDVEFSTAPSQDADSGAIDVGGVTLNDIFSAPPHDPNNASLASQHAFPETRWNGFTTFSSGYGSRVDVSAPADNVIALSHTLHGDASAITLSLNGGTSASAPEVAAAAAVVLQVARLTNNKKVTNPAAVRNQLVSTGTQVPNVPQADTRLNVGPQINLSRAVQQLLSRAGDKLSPGVPLVSIEQRRNYRNNDTVFLSGTDPTAIDLSGTNALAWITIAPNWEGLPDKTRYQLTVSNGNSTSTLATTPWARLQPSQILAAAGLPLASDSSRSVTLTYTASTRDEKQLVTVSSVLTFGPAKATTSTTLAPLVPATVSGDSIPVQYDLSTVDGVSNPVVQVSQPGRVNNETWFRPVYTQSLTTLTGTINVPTSALPSGGIYGITITYGNNLYSDFAYTRYSPTGAARPLAPTVSVNGSDPGHFVASPYTANLTVQWDVRAVPGATAAILEVGDAGPDTYGKYYLVNNPNGSGVDNDGVNTGAQATFPLSGDHGSISINPNDAHLLAGTYQQLRIVPTDGQKPIGEVSDSISVSRQGVVPANGGAIYEGFGVDQHGNDGMLTEVQTTSNGNVLSSAETFDQNTGAITAVQQTSLSTNEYLGTIGAGGPGIVADDAELVANLHQVPYFFFAFPHPDGFTTYAPAGTGTAQSWNLPVGATNYAQAISTNQDGTTSYVLSGPQLYGSGWTITTGNPDSGTVGQTVNIDGPVSRLIYPGYNAFDVDTSTSTAVLVAIDHNSGRTVQPYIVTINLSTNSSAKYSLACPQNVTDVAVDPNTHIAALPTYCIGGSNNFNGATLLNLSQGTTTTVSVGGYGTEWPVNDSQNHLMLMLNWFPADANTNANSNGSVIVTDEAGNVVENIEHFDVLHIPTPFGEGRPLQVNPATRTAFLPSIGGGELIPFHY